MKFIKKEYGYILLIILIVIGSGVLFFYPKAIEHKYPYSYDNLTSKKQIVENNNSTLQQNEGMIRSSMNELEDIKIQEEYKYDEAFEVRKTIKESDFEFKISSILISLEQRSYENNVDLKIDYSSIRHIRSDGSVNDYEPETNYEEEELELEEEEITINEQEPSENEEEIENDNFQFDDEIVNQGTIHIEGIDVAVIPITIEGSYYNVRNYIKYLDKIGMIEPSSVVLTSEEKIIRGQVILNVFHGEVGL